MLNLYQKLGRWIYAVMSFFSWAMFWSSCRTRVALVSGKDEKRQVLLVQGWLSDGHWGLPGGGIKKHEPGKAAAEREVKEEVGIDITHDQLKRTPGFMSKSRWNFCIHPLASEVDKDDLTIKLRRREINGAKWFSIDDLPSSLDPDSARVIRVTMSLLRRQKK